MISDWSSLKTMPGSKVLALVRDILLNELSRVESFEKQMIAIGLATRQDPARHAVELALGAAADIATFVLAGGEALKSERDGPPPKWIKSASDKDRWLKDLDRKQRVFVDIANQARAALMEDGLAERDDSVDEGDGDGSAAA